MWRRGRRAAAAQESAARRGALGVVAGPTPNAAQPECRSLEHHTYRNYLSIDLPLPLPLPHMEAPPSPAPPSPRRSEPQLDTGGWGSVAETGVLLEPIDNGAIRQSMCGPLLMMHAMSPGLVRATGAGGTQDLSHMQPGPVPASQRSGGGGGGVAR